VAQFGEGPCVFAFELVFDGGGAEIRRKDFPCVGFHFEVLAQPRIIREDVEGPGEVIGGGFEMFLRRGMERHMEVDPPFFDSASLRVAREGLRKVGMTFEDTVLAAGNHLMKVDLVAERFHEAQGRGGRCEAECRAEMELADADSGFAERLEGARGVFVFDCKMAGIVIDPEAALNILAAAELVEEVDGFRGILDPAERFRFEAEVQVLAGAVREAGEPCGVAAEILPDEVGVRFVGDEGFVTARDGADAAGQACGKDVRENAEKRLCVFRAEGRAPVGLEDLFLDAAAVEFAVGKAIDRENVAIVPVEPALEGEAGFAVEEVAGGGGSEPEADGVWLAGGDALTDAEGMAFEGGHGFRP